MSARHTSHVFAILRFDGFHSPGAEIHDTVTVKKIVRSEAAAVTEVERLNDLRPDSRVRYWYSVTRLVDEPE